jgi:ATP-binding cassette subfamily F protein 3
LSFSSSEPVMQIALQAFEELHALQRRMDEVMAQLEQDPANETLLHELGDLQSDFALHGGYEMEAKTHIVLDGLGFTVEDREKPFDTFSGGWRMRVLLARLLLAEPDVLLLDEPTNHLDLPTIQWMEAYVQKFPGAYVIVSHDRFFLDRMVNQVWELAAGRITVYDGNYSKYEVERDERRILQQAAFENQQQLISQSERFIERFRAKASKASQAQSRIKMLEKMDRVEAPEQDEATIHLRFTVKEKSGVEVLRLKNASKAFGEKSIFHNVTHALTRGDKVGLIGANGMGKTTLLRVLAGVEPFEGEREEGYRVKTGFYAQHQLDALHAKYEIWDEFQQEALDRGDTYVRTVLGAFLFSGDDIYKKIGVLSGGERARVALAKTLLAEANCLLLDEPTNHLDLRSIGLLTEALNQYEGTYIIVSHDRWFLERVTNKIWYLEDKQLKEYPGSYTEYAEWKQRQATQAALSATQAKQAAQAATNAANAAAKANGAAPKAPPKPQVDDAQRKNWRKELTQVEASIETLESRKAELEQALSLPENLNRPDTLRNLTQELQATNQDLDAHLRRWESLAEKVES